MSEPIMVTCKKCGQSEDMFYIIKVAVARGFREPGWVPKLCSNCIMGSLMKLGDDPPDTEPQQ